MGKALPISHKQLNERIFCDKLLQTDALLRVTYTIGSEVDHQDV